MKSYSHTQQSWQTVFSFWKRAKKKWLPEQRQPQKQASTLSAFGQRHRGCLKVRSEFYSISTSLPSDFFLILPTSSSNSGRLSRTTPVTLRCPKLHPQTSNRVVTMLNVHVGQLPTKGEAVDFPDRLQSKRVVEEGEVKEEINIIYLTAMPSFRFKLQLDVKIYNWNSSEAAPCIAVVPKTRMYAKATEARKATTVVPIWSQSLRRKVNQEGIFIWTQMSWACLRSSLPHTFFLSHRWLKTKMRLIDVTSGLTLTQFSKPGKEQPWLLEDLVCMPTPCISVPTYVLHPVFDTNPCCLLWLSEILGSSSLHRGVRCPKLNLLMTKIARCKPSLRTSEKFVMKEYTRATIGLFQFSDSFFGFSFSQDRSHQFISDNLHQANSGRVTITALSSSISFETWGLHEVECSPFFAELSKCGIFDAILQI